MRKLANVFYLTLRWNYGLSEGSLIAGIFISVRLVVPNGCKHVPRIQPVKVFAAFPSISFVSQLVGKYKKLITPTYINISLVLLCKRLFGKFLTSGVALTELGIVLPLLVI